MVGADPNVRDEAGNTALHLAALARPCPPSLAQTLIEHGAHLVSKPIVCDGKSVEKKQQYLNLCQIDLIHRILEIMMVKRSRHCCMVKNYTN